jgi:hypothetical protein
MAPRRRGQLHGQHEQGEPGERDQVGDEQGEAQAGHHHRRKDRVSDDGERAAGDQGGVLVVLDADAPAVPHRDLGGEGADHPHEGQQQPADLHRRRVHRRDRGETGQRGNRAENPAVSATTNRAPAIHSGEPGRPETPRKPESPAARTCSQPHATNAISR